MRSGLLLLTMTACAAAPAAPVTLGQPVQGVLTYYDADGQGACGYPSTADDFTAVDDSQWAASAMCGACLEVTGPNGKVVVRVVDRCPDCDQSHLDLRRSSFAKVADLSAGRVSASWRAVTCPTVGNMKLQLKDGSNPWWTAVLVMNHRRPVTKLEVKKAGAWQSVARSDYNYFVDESGFGEGPAEVRVTADDGSVVSATFPTVQAGATIEAAGQF